MEVGGGEPLPDHACKLSRRGHGTFSCGMMEAKPSVSQPDSALPLSAPAPSVSVTHGQET